MFSIPAFTLIAVIASAFVARADVSPTEPSPGNSFNEGSPCPIAWAGDTDSPTAWKNMTIELMSGDNEDMVHITTVTTGQDGTVSGTFGYTCPNVEPNSAIYFYQFTSPGSLGSKAWTTRFTIASVTGATTPPAHDTQPDGSNIPWGIGALEDPSQAVPAPGSGSAIPSAPLSSGLLPLSSTSGPLAAVTQSSSITTPNTSSKMIISAIASAPSSAPSTTSTVGSNTGSNGAIALSAASAMTFIVPALALIFL